MATYQRAIQESVYSFLDKYPEWYAVANTFYHKLMDEELKIIGGDETISYRKLFNQVHAKQQSERMVVGYISAIFHHWLSIGCASIVSIGVNETPSKDKAHDANVIKLSNLPNGFDSSVWFRKELEDGSVSWKDFKGCPTQLDSNFHGIQQSRLEVGYVLIETLFTHIKQSRTFSRWAYDSKNIYVFSLNRNEWARYFRGMGRGLDIPAREKSGARQTIRA